MGTSTPSGSGAFFYLIRPVNAGGPGTCNEGGSQIGVRDTEINAAPSACT